MIEDDINLTPMMEKVLKEWEYQDAAQAELNELLTLIDPGEVHGAFRVQYTETILKPSPNGSFH